MPRGATQSPIAHIPSFLVVNRWAAEGESGSHHEFRFRPDVWTILFHQVGKKITSTISTAFYCTTQSGGICIFLPALHASLVLDL